MSRRFADSRQFSLHTKDLAINRFADILNDAGYASPIRRPRGRDILAACGQLKTESERKRKAAE
jgi:23S rRNA (adenine2503-C2)-methyltransferase